MDLEMGNPAIEAQFKGAMRRLASGVALVTTADCEGTPYGIAMTAFMSLSMEPPSLLLAINKEASLCAPLLERGRFAINILGLAQHVICRAFVSTSARERFAKMRWQRDAHGIPLVCSAAANVICTVGQSDLFGSHVVVQGLVQDVILGDDSDPLIYLDGRYGGTTLHD
jgi:flavin reductase (DIM6/NTAB) family NADH-FMN oxidoreductase RutF